MSYFKPELGIILNLGSLLSFLNRYIIFLGAIHSYLLMFGRLSTHCIRKYSLSTYLETF